MKNLLLTVAALLTATSTFAATSATLVINGTVSAVDSVVIHDNAVNMPIVAGGTVTAATVDEASNRVGGYKINLHSANASKLVNTTNGTYKTAYTVSYDGAAAVSLSTTDQTVKTVSSYQATDTSNLVVNVTAFPTAPSGVYSDTITVSIVSNP
ncbi:MAG: hypothetical protein ACXWQQ_07400 [Pseudobdellovibrio sp.]